MITAFPFYPYIILSYDFGVKRFGPERQKSGYERQKRKTDRQNRFEYK
jgi:hypothetical protein